MNASFVQARRSRRKLMHLLKEKQEVDSKATVNSCAGGTFVADTGQHSPRYQRALCMVRRNRGD